MNKKLIWLLCFLVVACISCWATATSFHLMMPAMPEIFVWLMTIAFFLLSSLAMSWMVKSAKYSSDYDHPKAMFWGSLVLFIFTWMVISLPTNAHTFFYRLKIGDVLTDDLKTTKIYTQQLANREYLGCDSSEYMRVNKHVNDEWQSFVDEVKSGKTGTGFGEYAAGHISVINKLLGSEYGTIPIPQNTNKASDATNTILVNKWHNDYFVPTLQAYRESFLVSEESMKEAKKDERNIKLIEDSLHNLVQTQEISKATAEPLIKQAEGVLVVAYANINNNECFVRFNNEEDRDLYLAETLETKTTRFLNPYSVAWDFFTGKISFAFIVWIFLSILLDLSGFLFFSLITADKSTIKTAF